MKKTNSFKWDKFSDQPKVLSTQAKKTLRAGNLWQLAKLIATTLLLYPWLFLFGLFVRPRPNKKTKEFFGLCVNMDKGDKQFELVDELDVSSIQIRVFLNDIQNIEDYVKFARGFKNRQILINIIQDRRHIKDPELLRQSITAVFEKFDGITDEFMIGNAINRIKWQFIDATEYLQFYKTIYDLKTERFPHIKLVGSSVIDFEYHWTIRTLYNFFAIKYDKVSSLLYVDRRGAPQNRQMMLFDLANKIKFLCSIVKFSPKTADGIYITETNWPLKNTAPYAPTSELECVSMEDYTKYMVDYLSIASRYPMIKRVYWHQLIAAGYGLVDDRDGKIVKTKAYYKYKRLVSSGGHD